jgi:hypothetical protein
LTNDIIIDTIILPERMFLVMDSLSDDIKRLNKSPLNIRFNDLCKICVKYFGKARQDGTSHKVYKTPWQGDPRLNIQNNGGKAKAYQVRQVVKALQRLELENHE